jgi:hypothetical protein
MAQFKSRKFNLPKPAGGHGDAVFINDQAAISTAIVLTDTIDFVLPKGIELSSLDIYHTALAASAMTAKIGWAPVSGSANVVMNGVSTAPNDAQFKATAAFGTSATGFRCLFIPVTFEEDVLLRITIVASGVTPAAGTVYAIMGGNQVGVK